MGFISVWQLTLLTLAVVPLIVIAGGAYAVTMSTLSKKGEAAYAQAGKVSEEVITYFLSIKNKFLFSIFVFFLFSPYCNIGVVSCVFLPGDISSAHSLFLCGRGKGCESIFSSS